MNVDVLAAPGHLTIIKFVSGGIEELSSFYTKYLFSANMDFNTSIILVLDPIPTPNSEIAINLEEVHQREAVCYLHILKPSESEFMFIPRQRSLGTPIAFARPPLWFSPVTLRQAPLLEKRCLCITQAKN